jgi:hypothetical protein
MKFPRKLVDRDPRKQEHVAAALKLLIAVVGKPTITARTQGEMRTLLGADADDVMAGCPVTATVPSDNNVTLLGALFFFEQGLLFPDNILVACKACKTPLQIRPESLLARDRYCVFCATDQVLADYWKNRTRKKK